MAGKVKFLHEADPLGLVDAENRTLVHSEFSTGLAHDIGYRRTYFPAAEKASPRHVC
jgi:hypothetical protein